MLDDVKHAEATGPIAATETQAGLAAIRLPECGAVLWRRPLRPDLTQWLDEIAPDRLPSGRCRVRAEDAGVAVAQFCAVAQTPRGGACHALIEDIASLAACFARLMGTADLTLRLEVVTTDMCRRFHQDMVRARLICTYRGTGTQYGAAFDAPEPAEIHTAPTGSPLILRGADWPGAAAARVLHRSPPIAASGETRLLLVLDPADTP